MSLSKEQITGLILAGGKGSRMDGVDKGLQEVSGAPMVLHVLNRLRPQVDSLIINANRHLDEYRKFGPPVCSDAIEGYAGPLAGIHAGLLQCRTDYLVIVPCDSPLICSDLVQRLADGLSDKQIDAVVAVTGSGAHLQRHPVFMLLRTSLLKNLSSFLEAGGRKVDNWLTSVRCAEVFFENDTAFLNVNSRCEIDALPKLPMPK